MKNALILWCALFLIGAAGYGQTASQPSAPQSAPASSDAQAGSAALEGAVMDETKAVIPGASVKVKDSAGHEFTVMSDATGHYSVSGLAAGQATVTITYAGFGAYNGSVDLAAGAKTTLDAQMSAASASPEVVEVKGAQAMELEYENAEVSGKIEEKRIVGFGLNGRNFLSLITLAPGVSNQTGQDEAKVGVVGSAKFSVNGGRVEYNTFDVDGNDLLNSDIAASHGHSTLLAYPSLDAIQDMKVLTSNYGAQYGRSASGTVQVQLKGGEAKYHGNAYEFIRNEAFNARNYFDLPGKAPLYRRQDFGFTFGGPLTIPHKGDTKPVKTFFFVSEEWRKERTPLEFNQGVPTDAERGYNLATQSYTSIADFSDVCPPGGYSAFTSAQYPDCPGIGHGGAYDAFANNQFYIDPNATALLESGVIPRANATTGCVSSIGSCYVAAVSPPTDYREDLLRIDHPFNDNWKVYMSAIHDHWQTDTAVPQWATHVNSFPTYENSFLGPGGSAVVHLTSVLTPTFLNDFSVGVTGQRISLEDIPGSGVSFNLGPLQSVADPIGSFFQNCAGGTETSSGCTGGKLPSLIFGGTNAEYGGAGFNVDSSYMPWFHTRIVGTITDNMSRFLNKHALLFGGQYILAGRHEFGGANGANSGDQQGQLTFTNQGCFNASGNAFAGFEYNNTNLSYSDSLGGSRACNYQQDNTQITYKVRYYTLEPYFQDNYKIGNQLTVNLGLRVSLFQNWHPTGTTLENWEQSAFNPGLPASNNVTIDSARGYLAVASTATANSLPNPIPFDGSNVNPVLTNGLVQCGVNGVPDSCQSSHLFNAAPRIGFAWDPTGKGLTSIRAGYGVFFEHGTGSEGNVGSLMGNPPQVLSMSEDNPDSYGLIGKSGNGHSTGAADDIPIETPLNMVSIPASTTWPYVQQWSFGVQRAVTKDLQVSAAYVGSKGTHLAFASQLNQLPTVPAAENPFAANEPILQSSCAANGGVPGSPNNPWGQTPSYVYLTLPDGSPLYYQKNPAAFNALVAACNGYSSGNGNFPINFARNALRPFHGVGDILAIRDVANSSYNSLQLTAHQVGKPVDIAATLTYSHSIDTSSDRFSSGFVDAYNPNSNRASSDFDERVLLNVNYIYPLPMYWIGRAFRQMVKAADDRPDPDYNELGPIAKRVLDDWSLTGLTIYQTGTPFSVFNAGSSNGVSVSDNGGYAFDAGNDSYPDINKGAGQHSPCFTRAVDSGAVGPIIGNSCEFQAPQGLTRGDAGRNFLRNPSRLNFDTAILKDIKFQEGRSLQFRAEAFNVFNHTQFILYDPTKGNTSSNTVSCYGDITTQYSAGAATCDSGNGFLHPVEAHRPRTMQFGLKLQF